MDKVRIKNAKIDEIGMYVIPHYNAGYVAVILESDLGKREIRIPDEKVATLVRDIIDDVPEDGAFLHELIGKYVRVKEYENGAPIALGHIINDEWLEIN